jgi:anti-anti-sigma factor
MSAYAPMPGGLSVEQTVGDGVVTVTLVGELDLASVPVLEQRLEAIERERAGRIVIDLAGVSFIDSSGLRVLLLAAGRAREGEYELRLTQPTDAVRRVLEMTGALDLLRLQP